MKTIPVWKFTPPNCRKELISCEVEDDEAAKFAEAQAAGLRFTVERLSTGHISMCLEDPALGDFDCVVCDNGPEVVTKRREMLLRFNPTELPQWRESVS